ncbi:MAG: HEAT repeat domain-containing protein [Chthonomonadales bacterium]
MDHDSGGNGALAENSVPPVIRQELSVDDEFVDAVLTPLGKLHPFSPVRRLATSLIQGKRVDGKQSAIDSLKNPPGWTWHDKIVAAWCLSASDLSPQDRDQSTDILLEALEDKDLTPILFRALKRSVLSVLPVAVVGWFFVEITSNFQRDPPQVIFLMIYTILLFFSAPALFPLSCWYDVRNKNRLRVMAATSLGRLGSMESVGVLAKGLTDRDRRVRETCANALSHILPNMTNAHYGVLGSESMIHLGNGLSNSDSQLVLKILSALEKVGTSKVIPFVARVADRGRSLKLRDAARETLSILERRAIAEQQRDKLLRPSANPATPSDILLRPASDAETEVALLLRVPSSE